MKKRERQSELDFHKSFNYTDAESWDIQQQIQMTPEERQAVARQLRIRVYGSNPPDVRESHRKES